MGSTEKQTSVRGREKETESDNRLDEVAVKWPKHACGKVRARTNETSGANYGGCRGHVSSL